MTNNYTTSAMLHQRTQALYDALHELIEATPTPLHSERQRAAFVAGLAALHGDMPTERPSPVQAMREALHEIIGHAPAQHPYEDEQDSDDIDELVWNTEDATWFEAAAIARRGLEGGEAAPSLVAVAIPATPDMLTLVGQRADAIRDALNRARGFVDAWQRETGDRTETAEAISIALTAIAAADAEAAQDASVCPGCEAGTGIGHVLIEAVIDGQTLRCGHCASSDRLSYVEDTVIDRYVTSVEQDADGRPVIEIESVIDNTDYEGAHDGRISCMSCGHDSRLPDAAEIEWV